LRLDERFNLGTQKLPQVLLLNTGDGHIGAIKVDYKYKAPHQKHT